MTISAEPPSAIPERRNDLPHPQRDEAEEMPSEGSRLGPGSISAVVPTFNDVGRLGDALASIVNQTLPPDELVVADDGSTDGTERFVREFAAAQADRVVVRYVRLASHSGGVAARNEGISAARGEWIAECDSDDVWAPAKLERQTHFIRDWKGSQRIAILGTHGYNMNDAKRIISPAIMGPTTENEYDALRRNGGGFYMLHSSVLYLRSDFFAIGGYTTEYGTAEDFDLLCRMAERGVAITVSEPLVYYRKRAGSMQLDNFWDKHRGTLRATENQRRRVAGQAPIGREEFEAQLAAAPVRERLRRRKRTLGMYYYRSGSANVVNGRRLRGGLQLLLAASMDWPRVRAGLRNMMRSRLRRDSRTQIRQAPDGRAGPVSQQGAGESGITSR
jgi:glycosyltransferase involved in cell wall biosynthesis